MKLLSMNTAIYSCTRLEELAAEFSIGRGDVILTNRYILSGAALDAMSGRVLAAATLSGLYPAPEE